MKVEEVYTIGEVANILDIKVKDIRHFEYDNLISPSSPGLYDWNLFNENDINKLKTILYMISGGFTNEEIKEELEDN